MRLRCAAPHAPLRYELKPRCSVFALRYAPQLSTLLVRSVQDVPSA